MKGTLCVMCKQRTAIWAAVTLALTCVACAAEKPSTDFIAASLVNQENACQGSLQVEYTVTGQPTVGDRVPIWAIRYVRTPAFVYAQDRDLPIKDDATATTDTMSYDRATGTMNNIVARVKDGVETAWNVFDGGGTSMSGRVTALYCPDPLYMLSVPFYQAIRCGSVGEQPEVIDGFDCWRVDVSGPSIGHGEDIGFIIWVDPTIGFCPRLIHRTFKGLMEAPVTTRISFSDYRQLGTGVWLPWKVVIQRTGADRTVECDVQTAQVGVSLSPGDTQVTFKPGTEVWDMLLRLYRVVQ